jgi:hypothetical protein
MLTPRERKFLHLTVSDAASRNYRSNSRTRHWQQQQQQITAVAERGMRARHVFLQSICSSSSSNCWQLSSVKVKVAALHASDPPAGAWWQPEQGRFRYRVEQPIAAAAAGHVASASRQVHEGHHSEAAAAFNSNVNRVEQPAAAAACLFITDFRQVHEGNTAEAAASITQM